MYSPEHVAKVYIFVFVHNSSYHFYLINSVFIDLHQKKDIPHCLQMHRFTIESMILQNCYKMLFPFIILFSKLQNHKFFNLRTSSAHASSIRSRATSKSLPEP